MDQILYLIKEPGATTTETWHDPYGPLPRPAAGAEGLDRMRDGLHALVERSHALRESISKSDLPDEYRQLLEHYYAKKVKEAQDELAYWDRPIEDIRREKIEQIRKQAS